MATKKTVTKKAATKKAADKSPFKVVTEGRVIIELKCGENVIIEDGEVFYDKDAYRDTNDSYYIDKKCLPMLRDLIKIGQSLPKTKSMMDLYIEYDISQDYSNISVYYCADGVSVRIDDSLDKDKPDVSYPDFIALLDAIDKALGK
jgi:hypothetical protein